jgi:hypothetical protein
MRWTLGAAALMLGLTTTAAHAEYFETGATLLAKCKSGYDGAVVCLGYITGVADSLAAGNTVNHFTACMPKIITAGKLQDDVVVYLEKNGDNGHFAAVGLVAAALAHAYPCHD